MIIYFNKFINLILKIIIKLISILHFTFELINSLNKFCILLNKNIYFLINFYNNIVLLNKFLFINWRFTFQNIILLII
jgi:hypothetical protein